MQAWTRAKRRYVSAMSLENKLISPKSISSGNNGSGPRSPGLLRCVLVHGDLDHVAIRFRLEGARLHKWRRYTGNYTGSQNK